jgi:signal transduction histidine kinase
MQEKVIQQLHKAGLEFNNLPTDLGKWQKFLNQINSSYNDAAQERLIMGRKFNHVQNNTTKELNNSIDTTGNNRTNMELHKLRLILSSISDGLCAFDKNGRIIFINNAAKNYLEIQNKKSITGIELLSRFKFHDQWKSDEHLTVNSILQMFKDGGSLRDNDATLLQSDKNTLPIFCAINPIIYHRIVIGSAMIFKDITENKRIEQDLISMKNSAEIASDAKSDFLSSMSHELRTPMNAILGYGEILEEDLEYALEENEELEEYIDDFKSSITNILNAGRSLLGLINGVLDLTRIEKKQLDIEIKKLNLVDIIASCIVSCTPDLIKEDISLKNEIDKHQNITVLADKQRLIQVIDNLLSNAIKHNKTGGSIILDIEQSSNAECVRLLIEDTGVGVPLDQYEQIFKPFIRISGRNLSKGTGVGLTITQQLLEIMGGQIGLDSEVDVGSIFWIELPTGEKNIQKNIDVSNIASLNIDNSKYSLLYVEDSRTNVSLMKKILKSRTDIALIPASTGELGIELAYTYKPDLILLDINLPGINGFEVLKRLRKIAEIKDTPILGLSANDTAMAIEQAKNMGFYSYMIKPLDKKLFLKIISEILN